MRRISMYALGLVSLLMSCTNDCPDGYCNTEACPFCPDAALLVYPINNEACEPGEIISETEAKVVLEWQYAQQADEYELKVLNQQTQEVQTFSGITINKQEVRLSRSQAYTWWVTSYNQRAAITQTSAQHQFYLQGEALPNYAPFAPTLLTPESGKSIDSGEVLFSWEARDLDGDTLSYTLYVDTIDGRQTPPATQRGISATQKALTLESGRQYYYRVEASDGEHTSSSVTRSFRTK